MPLTRSSLIDVVAERLGWCRAYDTPTEVEAVLTEQTETACTAAAVHAQLATDKNKDALHVQPGVLDVRRRVLADVAYLEGVLTGAYNRGLPTELIKSLEDAVRHGHELTVLLAEAARCTTAPTNSSN
ncbi:hypothetical protein [Streptomyces longwoodensis]|uniref:hypothetical protein n=1 Tax=Streptomyces longwoodensis TaxID=68231 RepID=UPI00384C5B99